jgi:2-methylcitrate dehydratase
MSELLHSDASDHGFGEPQSYMTARIAEFVKRVEFTDISPQGLLALKRNILDSIACAIAAVDGEPLDYLRDQIDAIGARPVCTMIGGGKTSPDQAALFNSVLVRYADVLDSYMANGGLCHPSDNFGAVLAAAEYVDASGADFILALAIAYEVQCRFTRAVPVMYRGLNHALQLAIAIAAAGGKLLHLDAAQIMNAIAISAADNVSLACVHVEPVSHWKGISPGITAKRAVYNTMLAMRGFTGPKGLFEGPSGLERLFDQKIAIDWTDRGLNVADATMLKKYCALVHGQPVIETVLHIRGESGVKAEDIDGITAEVFGFAYEIAGGGDFGPKDHPVTKEQADYNLKYLIAVALIDGQVGPEQLLEPRINESDVQKLLRRVEIKADEALTQRYPREMPVRITIRMKDGRVLAREQNDYEGARTRPLSWERVVEKFHWLSEPYANERLRHSIVRAVEQLESAKSVRTLTGVLETVNRRRIFARTLSPL